MNKEEKAKLWSDRIQQCQTSGKTCVNTLGRVDAPLAVVRPSQNPDLRLSRIRLFAKRIVHIYQLYTLTYIRGLTSG